LKSGFPYLDFKYHNARPIRKLLYLYHGQYLKIVLSIILFAIKNSPVWILPVIIVRMIDIISDTKKYALHDLWVIEIIFLFIILQNIATHTFYVRVFSGALNKRADNFNRSSSSFNYKRC
jgi:ATP-binding cassette subfamily B protein